MQASSFSYTKFTMESKLVKPNRHIGTNKQSSVESYKGYFDSIKRKKIDSTDWNRPVGNQGGNLSDNCVFTRAGLNRHIPKFGGSDTISPKRASNHRYGPGIHSVASGAVGRKHLVPRRSACAHRIAGTISSRWTQHADNWWVSMICWCLANRNWFKLRSMSEVKALICPETSALLKSFNNNFKSYIEEFFQYFWNFSVDIDLCT